MIAHPGHSVACGHGRDSNAVAAVAEKEISQANPKGGTLERIMLLSVSATTQAPVTRAPEQFSSFGLPFEHTFGTTSSGTWRKLLDKYSSPAMLQKLFRSGASEPRQTPVNKCVFHRAFFRLLLPLHRLLRHSRQDGFLPVDKVMGSSLLPPVRFVPCHIMSPMT